MQRCDTKHSATPTLNITPARKTDRNNPDIFCYICGEYTLTANRKPV